MQQDQNPDEFVDDMDGMEEDLAVARSRKKKHLGNRVKPPHKYAVILHNDDYTPMEFVVFLLKKFFNKNNDEATKIMLHVHQNGIGVCGVFPYEIAETKVIQVLETAKKNDHPLQCTMEKD